MTKFGNKQFTVGEYTNRREPVCELCGQWCQVYYLIPERLCPQCYEIKKKEKILQSLQDKSV